MPFAEAQLVFDQVALGAPTAMARYADAYEATLRPEVARNPYRGLYPEREMWRHFRGAKLRAYTMRNFRSVLVRRGKNGGSYEEDAYVKLRQDHPALAAVSMPERVDGSCDAATPRRRRLAFAEEAPTFAEEAPPRRRRLARETPRRRAAASSSACVEHAVVLAAHYDARSNASLEFRDEIFALHEAARSTWMPRGLVLVVENDAIALSARAAAKRGLAYARNRDYPSYGFELGAWRWALREELPRLNLCDDAVIYLTQDSLVLNDSPLDYPPRNLTSTRIYSFDGLKPLLGVPRKERHWAAAAAEAFRSVQGADFDRRVSRETGFAGCFGPNLAGTYAHLRSLLRRGVFDMMRAKTKLDEQRSERILGLFLERDAATRDAGAVGGDYLKAQRAKTAEAARRAKLPFRKIHGYSTRSRERWHR